jgi:hypothetical protein
MYSREPGKTANQSFSVIVGSGKLVSKEAEKGCQEAISAADMM